MSSIFRLSYVALTAGGVMLTSQYVQNNDSFSLSGIFKRAHATTGLPSLRPEKKWDWNWDGNESNAKTKTTRHIILVRHGQYIYQDDDLDCHLTKLGFEQAKHTGKFLKSLDLPYDRIVYSTMTRAVETAEEIMNFLPDVPISPCNYVREGAVFPPEPPFVDYNPSMATYYADNARVEAGFRQYFHRTLAKEDANQRHETYDVIVCHGNVIRYFLCRALQLPPEAWARFSLSHASVTWLTIRPDGRVVCRMFGTCGHIPPEKVTYN